MMKIHLCPGRKYRLKTVMLNLLPIVSQLKAQIHGRAKATYCCIQGWKGKGEDNIASNPVFVKGPNGKHYLDRRSPCIDAGSRSSAAAGLSCLTTQATGTPDGGTVDIGYHYPVPPPNKPEKPDTP